jgi:hypothetical protein
LKIEEGHASGSNTHLLLLENSFIVNWMFSETKYQ